MSSAEVSVRNRETRAGLLGAGLVVAVAILIAGCSSDEPSDGDPVVAQSLDDGAAADAVEAGGADTDTGSDSDGDKDPDGDQNGDEEPDPADVDADVDLADPSAEVGPILGETGQDLTGEELERYLARRFEAYWQAFDIARTAPTSAPETAYPELANLAAGEQLERAHEELKRLYESGQAIREPETPAVAGLDANTAHRVRIDLLEEGVAELSSCLVNDQVHYSLADGAVVSDAVRTVQIRSTMARADGTWKVIRSEAAQLDGGVAGCWLEDESRFPY